MTAAGLGELDESIRALREEVDLWPVRRRKNIIATLIRCFDFVTQQLRQQRENSRRKP